MTNHVAVRTNNSAVSYHFSENAVDVHESKLPVETLFRIRLEANSIVRSPRTFLTDPGRVSTVTTAVAKVWCR